ncbi:MAG: NAD(P)/FAD-dependent oxidoreductase [Anaerosacchariphilus sp.]
MTLLEKNKQVGKKILVTGNGRCNLTNRDQSPDHYRSAEPDFVAQVLSRVGMQDILKKFTEFGIFTKNRNGYLYPYSDQAASVAEVLRLEAEYRGVKLALNTEAQAITREENSFQVQTEGWSYPADAVILTCRIQGGSGDRIRRRRLQIGGESGAPNHQTAPGAGTASM